jgi:hypothetical protein
MVRPRNSEAQTSTSTGTEETAILSPNRRRYKTLEESGFAATELELRATVEPFAVMDADGNPYMIPRYSVVHTFRGGSEFTGLGNREEFASFVHLKTRYFARKEAIATKTKPLAISPLRITDERDC